jgi:hypothetical protein
MHVRQVGRCRVIEVYSKPQCLLYNANVLSSANNQTAAGLFNCTYLTMSPTSLPKHLHQFVG